MGIQLDVIYMVYWAVFIEIRYTTFINSFYSIIIM